MDPASGTLPSDQLEGFSSEIEVLTRPESTTEGGTAAEATDESVQVHFSFVTHRLDITVNEAFLFAIFRPICNVVGMTLKTRRIDERNRTQHGYGFGFFRNFNDAVVAVRSLRGRTIDGITYDCNISRRSERGGGARDAGEHRPEAPPFLAKHNSSTSMSDESEDAELSRGDRPQQNRSGAAVAPASYSSHAYPATAMHPSNYFCQTAPYGTMLQGGPPSTIHPPGHPFPDPADHDFKQRRSDQANGHQSLVHNNQHSSISGNSMQHSAGIGAVPPLTAAGGLPASTVVFHHPSYPPGMIPSSYPAHYLAMNPQVAGSVITDYSLASFPPPPSPASYVPILTGRPPYFGSSQPATVAHSGYASPAVPSPGIPEQQQQHQQQYDGMVPMLVVPQSMSSPRPLAVPALPPSIPSHAPAQVSHAPSPSSPRPHNVQPPQFSHQQHGTHYHHSVPYAQSAPQQSLSSQPSHASPASLGSALLPNQQLSFPPHYAVPLQMHLPFFVQPQPQLSQLYSSEQTLYVPSGMSPAHIAAFPMPPYPQVVPPAGVQYIYSAPAPFASEQANLFPANGFLHRDAHTTINSSLRTAQLAENGALSHDEARRVAPRAHSSSNSSWESRDRSGT